MMIFGKQLVKEANKSSTIRSYLGVPDWKDIIKITPNSVHRLVGFTKDGRRIINANFYTHRKYKTQITTNLLMALTGSGVYKHLAKRFGQDRIPKSIYERLTDPAFVTPRLIKFATTGNLNPDSGDPGTTCCDGTLEYKDLGGASWATIQGAANATTASASQNSCWIGLRCDTNTDKYDLMYRLHAGFDTSSMGAGATATAGTAQLYGVNKADNLGGLIGLVSSTPASNTTLAAGDYDGLGSTRYATDIDIGAFSTSGYNSWTLNATGLAAVVADGITNLGWREDHDADNSEPTWGSGQASRVFVRTAENASSDEPILNITYTEAFTPQAIIIT